MVVAHYLDQWLKKRQEERLARAVTAASAKAYSEARAETQQMWEAWNNRRLAAEAAGRPFDEPPPSIHPNGQENQ